MLSRPLAAAAILVTTPHCLHVVERNPPPPVTTPDAFSRSGDGSVSDEWWRAFDDDDLTALVDRALADNFELKIGWARLEQAEAIALQRDTSPLFPSLNLDGNTTRRKQQLILPTGPQTFEITNHQLSLGAAYELDLWGKLRSQYQAGQSDVAASRDDVEALAMTLTANVADTWYSLVAQRTTERLLADQLSTNETFLELVTLRYQQGLTSALDVHQQRQQVARTRAELAEATSRRRVLEQQLAVLVGRPPREVVASGLAELPNLPPLPATGLPSELLVRRPDVRSARHQVEAADARIGAALADMFPSLRLSASISYSAVALADLFDTLLWNLAASIAQPVFEGGRRKAELDRTHAVLKERTGQFGQTFLTAVLEVENALVQEEQQLKRLEHLQAQSEHAEAALREARARYVQGLSDFLPVLNALETKQQVDQVLVTARRQLLSFRIQLCRALGGTWSTDLQPPGASEEDSNA